MWFERRPAVPAGLLRRMPAPLVAGEGGALRWPPSIANHQGQVMCRLASVASFVGPAVRWWNVAWAGRRLDIVSGNA